MRRRATRVEVNTSLKLFGRLSQLQVTKKDIRERGVCFADRIVQLQRLLCRRFCTRIIILRRARSVDGDQRAAVGDPCVSERVVRVLLCGLLKKRERLLEVSSCAPV